MRSLLRAVIIGSAATLGLGCTSSVALASVVGGPPLDGVVKDSAGRPLANVQVIVSALNRRTTTDAGGHFAFLAIPVGSYRISTLLIGYAPGRVDTSVPADGENVHVTIVMHQTPLQITGMAVTATPIGVDARDVTQGTVDLDGAALSRQLGSTIAQTLVAQPGVAMRFDGPAATAPVIRGLQGERVLVLQDGNRAADLSSSAPDHGTSIDPLSAERIEVVRGPASLLYGNQALGGVVNVISNDIPTSIPSHVEGTLAGTAESATPGGAGTIGVTMPLGNALALVAKGGARHTGDLRMGGGGELTNTFFHNRYGVGGLGFNSGRATGGLAVREYEFQYGLPSADDEVSKIDGHRHEVLARADVSMDKGVLSSLRVNATAQWYAHSEVDEATGHVNTSFDLKTQTVDLTARTRMRSVNGAIGMSGLFKQYGARGEEALTPAATSNGVGVFLFQEVPLGAIRTSDETLVPKFQVGGRYDLYRIDLKRSDELKFAPFVGTHDYHEVSASIGVSIPINAAWTFATSASRAFRAPSVEELASNAFHEGTGTYDMGNPALRPEINQGVEGVFRLQTPRSNGQVAVFGSAIQNFITPNVVKDTAAAVDDEIITAPLNRVSQGNARLHGAEGQFEVAVARHVAIGAMGDVVRAYFTASHAPLPFIPAARLGGLARWDDSRFSMSAEYRHAFAQNHVPAAVSDDDPAGVASSAYDLITASTSWTVTAAGRVHTITLRVDNLLDERYVDATSRIKTFAFNPGRNLALVYRVLF